VSVCPTECRIFGDLDDPSSRVAEIVQRDAWMVRKPEKGTGPKIFYLGADESAIRPEIAARPFMFREGRVHLRPLGAPDPDPERPGDPRVDYDVPHQKAWGFDLVLYLITKGVSTGAMLLSALLWLMGDRTPIVGFAGPFVSLIFAAFTAVVLIVDLERPERFYYILARPNWTSWLAKGAVLLTAHGALTTVWLILYLMEWTTPLVWIAPVAIVAALGATAYTGLLFAQGLARDLWQGPHATIDLVALAIAEGSAAMLLMAVFAGADAGTLRALGLALALASIVHVAFLVLEHLFTPSPTLNHELAVRAIRHGAFRRHFWLGALGLGVLSVLFVGVASLFGYSLVALVPAALTALAASLAWEYVWVEAGQSVPNS
jgi:Ni/Fe-hydrogenase subunit HybB-like protein